jgi:exodeoxyribonuclease V beta subunit
LLALRLIIEKEISIKEILMVTFTKAAVAELEERIRLFVREAHQQMRKNEIQNNDIGSILQNSIAQSSHQNVENLLKNAVLFLDETSVLTIHSFCQLTLNEFAFETQQLFGAELVQDHNNILENEVNQFWRSYVTTICPHLLALLLQNGLTRKNITDVVINYINGKKFFVYEEGKDYTLDEQEVLATIAPLEAELNQLNIELKNYVVNNIERLKTISQKNTKTKKKSLANFSDIDKCLNIIATNDTKYIEKLYPDIIEKQEQANAINEQITLAMQPVIDKIICNAITQVSTGLNNSKQLSNQLSFDDLIVNLNKAILKPNNANLIKGLQKKYKAVFIDEFQDTDRQQYQIFDTAFNTNTLVFYIGDPKQSIYAWRKADIFTYFEAQKAAHHCYSMNYNFRSCTNYIAAMNLFFAPTPGFDVFHFAGNSQSINYVQVNAPSPNKKGNLLNNNTIEQAITLTVLNNKDRIAEAVANQISELLSPQSPFVIHAEGASPRRIKPSDIGILVPLKKESAAIQTLLAKLGIPSVAIIEAKILESAEATHILYFLLAVADINRSSINRALLSPFTGYCKNDILALDMQHATQLFRKYKTLWDTEGIFATIKTFTADFDSVKKLMLQNAEQTLTNIQQLTELLHKTQTSKKLSNLDLINWLKRGTQGQKNEGDEYQQRIESDNEAVKIITIHTSKGLEYNIVFAPYLDIKLVKNHTYCNFREPETGQYVTIAQSDLSPQQYEIFSLQQRQEYSRLIYVAITRAVYKCYIYHSTSNDQTALTHFIKLKNDDNQPQLIPHITHYPPAIPYQPLASPATSHREVAQVSFELMQKNWRKLSYSYLKAPYQYYPKNKTDQPLSNYDNFIFNQLAKGAKAGNMLHYIFENITFNNPLHWPRTIDNAITQFAIKDAPLYQQMLPQMLYNVLHAPIKIGEQSFTLSALQPYKCIHEFEFDFPVSPFQVLQLKKLADADTEISLGLNNNLEGVMNGKIDLFFEHEEKYYLLDWKSNYLGDTPESYNNQALSQAMNQSNYHLQYLIYTLAAQKYLTNRLPNLITKRSLEVLFICLYEGCAHTNPTAYL